MIESDRSRTNPGRHALIKITFGTVIIIFKIFVASMREL
jgi:hypothetical protein